MPCAKRRNPSSGAATFRSAPAAAMPLRAIVEPENATLASAMPHQIEVAVGQQVCDRFRKWSEELCSVAGQIDTLEIDPALARS